MVTLYDIFMVYLKKKVNNKKVIRGCYLSVRICSNQNQFNNSTDGVGIYTIGLFLSQNKEQGTGNS